VKLQVFRFFFIIFIPTCSILKDCSLSKNVLDKNAEENMIPLLQLSNLFFFTCCLFYSRHVVDWSLMINKRWTTRWNIVRKKRLQCNSDLAALSKMEKSKSKDVACFMINTKNQGSVKQIKTY
jgi:hypothetical protein